MYTEEQMIIANKTSRNSSAIGMKAIVPRYVKSIANPQLTILDFGSGKTSAHSKSLRKSGLNVTSHEFGDNVNVKYHSVDALKQQYDIVFASNVLNVQQSSDMLEMTLITLFDAVNDGGLVIVNYPMTPRKMDINAKQLKDILERHSNVVLRVGGTKQAPLFVCIG